MYPYKGMPDPKAGIRLEKIGCEIKFNKGILKTPIIPQSPDDLDNEGMPKLKSDAIWMIDVWMPRKFIDNFTDEKIKIGSEEVDVTDLNDAYTSGLDDNTNINSQEI